MNHCHDPLSGSPGDRQHCQACNSGCTAAVCLTLSEQPTPSGMSLMQGRLHLRGLVCSLSALAHSLAKLQGVTAVERDFVAAVQSMTAQQDVDMDGAPHPNGGAQDAAAPDADALDLMDLVGLTQDAAAAGGLAANGAPDDEEV